MKVKSESEVAQSCPTLSNPMDCSLLAPPSMGFSRQVYWSGVPLPSPFHCIYILYLLKTTMRYYLTPVRMAIIKKSANNKCLRGYGEKEPSCTIVGNVN